MIRVILICLVLVCQSFAQVSLDETVATADVDGGTTHLTNTITGGSDKTFVMFIAIFGDDNIFVAPTGGGLTWVEQLEAAVDGGVTGGHIFTAEGSASNFSVDFGLSSNSQTVVTHVLVFSGVATGGFEDAHYETFAGENSSAVNVGSDNPTFTIGNTSADAWFFLGLTTRNRTLTSGDEGLTNKTETWAGAGGDVTNTHTYAIDRGASTGDQSYSFTLSNATDWMFCGIVLNAAAPAGPASRFIMVD